MIINCLYAAKRSGRNAWVGLGYDFADPHCFQNDGEYSADATVVSKAAGWKLTGPKRAFLISGDDRVGAIADIIGQLADAKINVIAVDAVGADGRFGAILWVEPRTFKKAAQVLGAQ